MISKIHPRLIAYYLPQFYPVPENNSWWGKGFTEWTNVAKAKPLFRNHYQPHYPADLGYYDLRVPEVRAAQENMAKQYGIEGFIYYHYWFGNGKMLLEKPLQDKLNSPDNDLPFCVCWANESWKGVWHGASHGKTLIEQTYPGDEDIEQHFEYLLPAFKDARYIKVDGKPVFNIYMPLQVPNIEAFISRFQTLAQAAGLPGIFFIASRCPTDWNPYEHGFSGVIGSEMMHIKLSSDQPRFLYEEKVYALIKIKKTIERIAKKKLFNYALPAVVEYADIIGQLITDKKFDFDYYPCIVPNWDNTPRAGTSGMVFQGSTPALFAQHLKKAIKKTEELPAQRQFIFIKSWNEWAEGNYLEPDKKFGVAYLEEIRKQVC